MRKVVQFLLVFVFVSLIWSSCKRKIIPSEEISIGQEYFPTEVDHFIEYAVDSFLYNDFDKRIDTFRFQVRDVIVDSFHDNENRLSQLITRYKRKESSEPWNELITYYATKTPFRVEVVEDNLRYIKFVFPVKENTRWYGNTYIPSKLNSELLWLDNWYYRYDRISLPFTSGFLIFKDAVIVNQQDYVKGNPDIDPDNYASKTYAMEAYAKNIGLVYKEIENWEYQSTVKYRRGFKIIYRATNYN